MQLISTATDARYHAYRSRDADRVPTGIDNSPITTVIQIAMSVHGVFRD